MAAIMFTSMLSLQLEKHLTFQKWVDLQNKMGIFRNFYLHHTALLLGQIEGDSCSKDGSRTVLAQSCTTEVELLAAGVIPWWVLKEGMMGAGVRGSSRWRHL